MNFKFGRELALSLTFRSRSTNLILVVIKRALSCHLQLEKLKESIRIEEKEKHGPVHPFVLLEFSPFLSFDTLS